MLATLEQKLTAEGITYRKGERSEAGKYSFKYIPHLVVADGDGKQLHAFEARALLAANKKGALVDTVFEKAVSLR